MYFEKKDSEKLDFTKKSKKENANFDEKKQFQNVEKKSSRKSHKT